MGGQLSLPYPAMKGSQNAGLSVLKQRHQDKRATLVKGSHVKEVSGLAENPQAPCGILMPVEILRGQVPGLGGQGPDASQ